MSTVSAAVLHRSTCIDRSEERWYVRTYVLTAGLIHPTGFFPSASRASFTAERIAAKVGADADVPEISLNSPFVATE